MVKTLVRAGVDGGGVSIWSGVGVGVDRTQNGGKHGPLVVVAGDGAGESV